MSDIKLLSPSMINKIAAGEVIERPSSVVKELVENAVDAGATQIEINVEKSGSDLIRIVDNGCGIKADQLKLALSPHATSKIADTEDLFKIKTLGFRGEALASIGEVCQLTVQSRTVDSPEGAEIHSDGGVQSELVPCGIAPGTIMSVRNIFFNIPARRKFLKSQATELGHITETINRLVLPQPGIHFIFRHNNKTIYDLPIVEDYKERIRKVFGNDVADKLIYVESKRGDIRVFGYVGHPDYSRPNYNLQYYFLNRRFIKDRSLQHALTEAYRGLLSVGRYPVAFLQIEVPPDFVDVNVHPTKMEVRFINPSMVYSGFLGAIREEFLRSDLKAHPHLSTDGAPFRSVEEEQAELQDKTDPQKAMDERTMEDVRSQVLNWSKGELESAAQVEIFPSVSPEKSLSPNRNLSDFIPYPDRYDNSSPDIGLSLHKISSTNTFAVDETQSNVNESGRSKYLKSAPVGSVPECSRGNETDTNESVPTLSLEASVQTTGNLFDSDKYNQEERGTENTSSDLQYNGSPSEPDVLQIQERYLVMETKDGLAIIDQHALHERILYESIRKQMNEGNLTSQRLLVPEAVDLTPVEMACTLENKDLFEVFGLYLDEFGGNTIVISAYPGILDRIPIRDILFVLLTPILDGGRNPNRMDLLDGMMHQMACKAAVKAGEHLTRESINELIRQANEEINSHHCPHGRPSTLVFTCQELDKLFKRT